VRIPLRNLISILLPALLYLPDGNAAQVLEVRDGAVVTARISSKEPTRLLIRGGRVHKIWGAAGKAVLKPDTETGQVYLQPDEGYRTRPFSLFVKDEAGAVYTLVLRPADIPSETVTLVRPEKARAEARSKAVSWETSQPYERTLLELVRHMATGRVPEGYSRDRLHREVRLWREARLVLRERYFGGRLHGEIYVITNIDQKPLRMAEREFYRDGVLAVAIEKHELQPGEQTRIYLISEAGKP